MSNLVKETEKKLGKFFMNNFSLYVYSKSRRKFMKKKVFSIVFASVFAILSMAGVTAALTYPSFSNVEIAAAALSASQTKTVQTKLKRWGIIFR